MIVHILKTKGYNDEEHISSITSYNPSTRMYETAWIALDGYTTQVTESKTQYGTVLKTHYFAYGNIHRSVTHNETNGVYHGKEIHYDGSSEVSDIVYWVNGCRVPQEIVNECDNVFSKMEVAMNFKNEL